jgi:glutamyl-tRNA synthetase
MSVRVRFAPSPTGFFHIGSARTALFNWLYARKTGGVFVLRIEDTDRQRNTDEALRVLVEGMRWLGLDWDEGPEAGGDFGPYFQSQRDGIYREYLEKLRANGRAYDKDGAVYFKISGEPQIIDDAVRGRVERTEDKDFVIFRSDGNPVFHFVNVVDDIAMQITHVIRGEDHLSNTSKHTELFKAFGAPLPVYAHIPLILKQHGPGKMSKRDQGALIEEYQNRGFLPEAVRNYLCLLGWSPKDDREKLPIEEIISLFDLGAINKSNARFDEKKLSFMNSGYLRELPAERFASLGRTKLVEAGLIPGDGSRDTYANEVLAITQEKTRAVEEVPEFTRYFFNDDFGYDEKAKAKIFGKGDPKARVAEFSAAAAQLGEWSEPGLEQVVAGLSAQHGLNTGEYIHGIRLAASGVSVGPSLYAMLRVLGRDRTMQRLERFVRES